MALYPNTTYVFSENETMENDGEYIKNSVQRVPYKYKRRSIFGNLDAETLLNQSSEIRASALKLYPD